MPSIESHAESVIEILAAQCADLEALLALARQEAIAAEKQDFERLFEITRERATLGERLEVYHRQIVEVRARMSETLEPSGSNEAARRAVALVMEIQVQDDHTHPLLIAARSAMVDQMSSLDNTQRNLSAYLRHDKEVSSVAYDQRA